MRIFMPIRVVGISLAAGTGGGLIPGYAGKSRVSWSVASKMSLTFCEVDVWGGIQKKQATLGDRK